ncbi:MAG: GntR family transcriptional regulator [Verrucomicrobiaceae bacterium]|nr:MAG: GntR family transcriptional regulator [Verrucomicrobiaceae bacterium]
MVTIGQYNRLRVLREAPPGLYLDAEDLGEVLLPRRYIVEGTNPGDTLKVFLYRDSEDRLVATTETPLAVVGDFALLRVISVNRQVGVFLDWGLAKDLLLPVREQRRPVTPGQWLIVHVLLDYQTGRIVASTRLNRFLNQTEPLYDDGQKVNLLVAEETELGYKAIVENAHWGLLYRNELAVPITIGEKLTGYIRTIREDGKIDLSLDPAGYGRIAPLTKQIIDALKANEGFIDLDDESSPEEIRAAFNVSKKAFKQALGSLFRERRIQFLEQGIQLLEEDVYRPGRRRK